MSLSAIHIPDRAASYHGIIGYYLTKSYTPAEYQQACEQDEDWQMPKMYAVMLEAVYSLIAMKNPTVTREQVKALDVQASGHTDYQARLAISCADLAAAYRSRHGYAGPRRRGLKI